MSTLSPDPQKPPDERGTTLDGFPCPAGHRFTTIIDYYTGAAKNVTHWKLRCTECAAVFLAKT